jgi:hypothetical protein
MPFRRSDRGFVDLLPNAPSAPPVEPILEQVKTGSPAWLAPIL